MRNSNRANRLTATAEGGYINKALRNDDVYTKNRIASFEEICNPALGLTSRAGMENVVISNGKVVNVVSKKYGHLPNEKFFGSIEAGLIGADVTYKTRSINRNDASFAVDYILDDPRFVTKIKNGQDGIIPMLRLVNSYDSSSKTSGSFGFFRKVCDNGLHVAHTNLGFSTKHSGNIVEIVTPQIDELIEAFFANEYYELSRKFEVMAETKITDLADFTRKTAEVTKLFKFEASDKNPEAGANARFVMEIIERESRQLGVTPNLWIGYNAVNQLIHDKLVQTFDKQKGNDEKVFEAVLEMAM